VLARFLHCTRSECAARGITREEICDLIALLESGELVGVKPEDAFGVGD